MSSVNIINNHYTKRSINKYKLKITISKTISHFKQIGTVQ